MRKIRKEYVEALRDASRRASDGDMYILCNNSWRLNEYDVDLVVNWAALGNKSPEETVEFANRLSGFGKLAADITALDLRAVEVDDWFDQEDYRRVQVRFTEAFETKRFDWILWLFDHVAF